MGSVQSARRIQLGGEAGGPGGRIPSAGPPPGLDPAPAGRISSAAVRRDRLRVGWEGFGVAGGSPLRRRVLQPPWQQLRRVRGAEGDSTASAPSPGNRSRPPLGARRGGEGGRGPLLPARLSTGADCAQCAPTASRRRAGRPTPGARGLRRCRLPT